MVLQHGLGFLLQRTPVIKAAAREEDMASRFMGTITNTLWGSYNLWLHKYCTR